MRNVRSAFLAIFACAHIWQKYLVEYLVEFCSVLIGGSESGGRAVITSFLTVDSRDIVNQSHLINMINSDKLDIVQLCETQMIRLSL